MERMRILIAEDEAVVAQTLRDEVEGLGTFLELEVVLQQGQPESLGREIAERWLQTLRIREDQLISKAYIDLLEERET